MIFRKKKRPQNRKYDFLIFPRVYDPQRKLTATELLKSWLIAYILLIVLSTTENNKEEKRRNPA